MTEKRREKVGTVTGAPRVGDELRLWVGTITITGPRGGVKHQFIKHTVRAVLADDKQVVRRFWNKHKQSWRFEVVSFRQHARDVERDGLTPDQER